MQGRPEFGHKELVTVGNNFFGQAVLAVPVVKEYNGKVFCGDVGFRGYDTNIRSELVGHRKDTVKSFIQG